MTAIANGGLVAVARLPVRGFPSGLPQRMVGLPWPLR